MSITRQFVLAGSATFTHHEGKCGRCSKNLTTPASITSGFGPECRKVLNIAVVPNEQLIADLEAEIEKALAS